MNPPLQSKKRKQGQDATVFYISSTTSSEPPTDQTVSSTTVREKCSESKAQKKTPKTTNQAGDLPRHAPPPHHPHARGRPYTSRSNPSLAAYESRNAQSGASPAAHDTIVWVVV